MVLLVALLFIAALIAFPLESMDRGTVRIAVFIVGATALMSINAWWLFGSGFSRRTRFAWEAVVILTAFAAVLSIRGVEFTGDMTPIFHFRWDAVPADVLEAHRAQQSPEVKRSDAQLSPALGWDEFSEYRGRARDGVVNGPALARDWTSDPPRLVWRQPIGGGYASFALAGGRAVTIEQRRDHEAVVAYDATTGKELWVFDYPALFSEKLGGDGPRATPTIADGRVYALGATGELNCLALSDGKRYWSVNILEQNGSQNISWGMSGSPLVYDDVVVVNPGAQGGSADSRNLVALTRETGQVAWRQGTATASYSSPMLAVLGGVRQILIFDAGGLAGYDTQGGAELWRTPWQTQFDINVAQPLVFEGRRVLITSASGAALYAVEHLPGAAWNVTEQWKTRTLKCSFANPVLRQGFVYGLDEGILVCIDVATGARQWKQGRYGHGQLLLAGDLLLILSEQGELVLVEASPEQFSELARIPAIEGKTWNCPVLVDGRAYIRNHLEMACYDLRAAGAVDVVKHSSDERGAAAEPAQEPDKQQPLQ